MYLNITGLQKFTEIDCADIHELLNNLTLQTSNSIKSFNIVTSERIEVPLVGNEDRDQN